jgi:hypothetical protein
MKKNKVLIAIIPSIRIKSILNTINSVINQKGFDEIKIIISGSVCLNKEFKEKVKKIHKKIYFTEIEKNKKNSPAYARNLALKFLYKLEKNEKNKKKWVIFVDDDIILVPNYAATIINFLEDNDNIIAAMGKMVSYPPTFINKIIDYSNFWWLQLDYDIEDLGWLGTGATVIEYKNLMNFYFNESFIVGEDVEFFNRIANKYKKSLGICSKTFFYHNHDRRNFFSLIKYQFDNGFYHHDWYYDKNIPLIKYFFLFFKNTWQMFKTAYYKNSLFYKKNKVLTIFVIFSFLICQLGVLWGSILNKYRK